MTGTQPHKSHPVAPGADLSETNSTGLSPQARQAIGIGGLILCLLIGAGIIYWFVIGSAPKQRTIKVDPSEQTIDTSRMRGGGMPRPRVPSGIVKGDNHWMVRGTAGMLIVTSDKSGGYRFSFGHSGTMLDRGQASLVAARFRIIQDPAMAKAWDVTPEQVEKLKKLQVHPGALNPSTQERDNVRQLWDAYLKAGDGQPRTEAQQKLIDRVDEIAKANAEAARKNSVASVEQIKQILTPEQMSKINK